MPNTELNETNLEKVTGGDEGVTFEYDLQYADRVYINLDHSEYYLILENVKTNDENKTVKCEKGGRKALPNQIIIERRSEYIAVAELMRNYKLFGGNIKSKN